MIIKNPPLYNEVFIFFGVFVVFRVQIIWISNDLLLKGLKLGIYISKNMLISRITTPGPELS